MLLLCRKIEKNLRDIIPEFMEASVILPLCRRNNNKMEMHAQGCTLKPSNVPGEGRQTGCNSWLGGRLEGPGRGARIWAGTRGTLGLSVNIGIWPSKPKWLSAEDSLPFRFRCAAVQNNGTGQTALGSNILKYFAIWLRMTLGSQTVLRSASVMPQKQKGPLE